MSKYYSLETLIEAKYDSFCDMYDLEDFLEEIPEEKILKITRCKDCKYYEVHKPSVTLNCERGGKLIPMMPDDFCSYAEQKEIEGE